MGCELCTQVHLALRSVSVEEKFSVKLLVVSHVQVRWILVIVPACTCRPVISSTGGYACIIHWPDIIQRVFVSVCTLIADSDGSTEERSCIHALIAEHDEPVQHCSNCLHYSYLQLRLGNEAGCHQSVDL